MRLEDLDKRDDLMVDLEKLKDQMDNYLENVSREELKNDLEKAGIKVQDISNNELDYYTSEMEFNMFEKDFVFESNNNTFSIKLNEENDIEEEEVELLAA